MKSILPLLSLIAFHLTAQPLLPLAPSPDGESVVDIPEEIIDKVDPSVVSIQHEQAGGTGFIISEDGYILSNGHVVRGDDPEQPMQPAKRITVILHDERKTSARVLGFSLDPDVALLKIDIDEPLSPVELADSKAAIVGQRCFAVGTPVGLKRTFTSGILSNTRRTDLETETVVFQTDAAINSGNSGGPLFDRQGRVLGINTYASRGANNLGFTIPIHVAMDMVEDLKTRGRFVRSLIPLYFTGELYDELRRALDVESGVLINYVMEGSAAEKMGMRLGDILIEVDGEPVSAKSKAQLLDFEWDMTIREAGEPVSFKVLRGLPGNREEVEFSGVLEELDPFPAFGRHLGQLTEHRYENLGLGIEKLTDLHQIIHRIPFSPSGVFVKTVQEGSVASRADLEFGDVITEINGTPTPTVDAFRETLDAALSSGTPEILVTAQRRRLMTRTALAPDYRLRRQKVLLVAPAGPDPDIDVILRELWAMGAEVRLATPGGKPIPREELAADVEADEDLKAAQLGKADFLVIAGGTGAEAFLEQDHVLNLVRNAMKDKQVVLGCIGTSALLPLLASEEAPEEKMTLPRAVSGRALALGGNYTGNPVESDGKLVTTTALDRQVLRDFLMALAAAR